MTDHLSREKRSWNMSQIKAENTKPELTFRSLLHKQGYRYSLFRKDLPGKPDLTMKKYKSVIFIHGCFWHRHKNCKRATTPKSNTTYWNAKFKRNVDRDKENIIKLKRMGWRVFVIWECELKNPKETLNKIIKQINQN